MTSTPIPSLPTERRRGWSLRTKTTVAAIILSATSALVVGGVSALVARQFVDQQIKNQQLQADAYLTHDIGQLIGARYRNVQVLGNDPALASTDPAAQAARVARLAAPVKVFDYANIAIFNPQGNLVLNAGPLPSPGNVAFRDYFKQAMAGHTFISSPVKSVSKVSNTSLFISSPLKDASGNVVGVVRSRILTPVLSQTLAGDISQTGNAPTYLVFPLAGVGTNGKSIAGQVFLSSQPGEIDRNAFDELPGLQGVAQAGKPKFLEITDQFTHTTKLVYFSVMPAVPGLPRLNWGVVYTTDAQTALAPERQILFLVVLVSVGVAVAGGAISALLAERASRPVVRASQAVDQIGQGDLSVRVPVTGTDELAVLGENINQMAGQIQQLLAVQAEATERTEQERQRAQTEADRRAIAQRQLAELAVAELPETRREALNTVLASLRADLGVDRVVVYAFRPDWSGYITGESVLPGWPVALAQEIGDPCIPQTLISAYRQGRVVPTADVFNANFHPDHLKLMERLQIKANLVVPVVIRGQLYGLLVAHHCAKHHTWEEREVALMKEFGEWIGVAISRSVFLDEVMNSRAEAERLADEQRRLKESLQSRALSLLMEVDPVGRGDLTVRARVTEDEIGTIADSYNATVASLRQIVLQVKAAAEQVAGTAQDSEGAATKLAEEAQRQTQEVTQALDRIQALAKSSQEVAADALKAEGVVQEATQILARGDEAMNRTVEGIQGIRTTVAETAKKIKRLGESSQKISKVVNLIGSFAAQTNLLALNASIEAARAGEEGRGFGVVAEEVRSLARQSAAATAEIEDLVAQIQTETAEVVRAMEEGTQQVVTGTELVDATRQTLNQIARAGAEIDVLVENITRSATSQSQVSALAAEAMEDVAQIAGQTAKEASGVSDSFHTLLLLAEELQATVSRFKISA